MIREFVDAFMEHKGELEQGFAVKAPESYLDLVKRVAEVLPDLDPGRVHEIDDGDYQGVLVYVIGREGYQP